MASIKIYKAKTEGFGKVIYRSDITNSFTTTGVMQVRFLNNILSDKDIKIVKTIPGERFIKM